MTTALGYNAVNEAYRVDGQHPVRDEGDYFAVRDRLRDTVEALLAPAPVAADPGLTQRLMTRRDDALTRLDAAPRADLDARAEWIKAFHDSVIKCPGCYLVQQRSPIRAGFNPDAPTFAGCDLHREVLHRAPYHGLPKPATINPSPTDGRKL